MTFNELILEVAKDAKLPRTKVARVLRSFIKVTRSELLSGGTVRLSGFGLFHTTKVKPGTVYAGMMKAVKKYIIRFREPERKRR